MEATDQSPSWMNKPRSGLTHTYTDRFGRTHTVPVRYPGVKRAPLAQAETVAPGLFHTAFALEGFHFCDRIDVYAVGDGEGALVVDTAHRDLCGEEFLDQLVEATGAGWDRTRLFLTHLHDDHVGNVPYCLDQGTSAVYRGSCIPFSQAAVQELLHVTGSRRAGETELDDFTGFLLGEGNPLFSLEPPVVEADEGASFDVAGWHLEVLDTPGHTAEHRCLVEPERGVLFAGDHLIFGAPGVMQLRSGQHLLRDYLTSMDGLRRRNLKTALLSHHEALTSTDDINGLIDRIVQAHEHPLEKTLGILRERGPLTVHEAAEAYDAKRPGGLAAQACGIRVRRIATMFGYLDYLVDTEQAIGHTDDEGVFVYEAR